MTRKRALPLFMSEEVAALVRSLYEQRLAPTQIKKALEQHPPDVRIVPRV